MPRDVTIVVAALALIAAALGGAPPARAANPVATENALPGDSSWTARQRWTR